jgi:YHS domain-containing protein
MKILKKLTGVLAFALTALLSQADEMKKAELGGYCPVCYISAGKAVEGKKEYTVEHAGKKYLFVSEQAVAAFKQDPSKYLPAYDGWCAFGMSLGKKFESDPTVFKVVDGRLFLNKNADVGKLFSEGTKEHISKADAEWKKMKM